MAFISIYIVLSCCCALGSECVCVCFIIFCSVWTPYILYTFVFTRKKQCSHITANGPKHTNTPTSPTILGLITKVHVQMRADIVKHACNFSIQFDFHDPPARDTLLKCAIEVAKQKFCCQTKWFSLWNDTELIEYKSSIGFTGFHGRW